jgi:hypothetical protein
VSQLRFSRRLYENYPYGASYGCAIERYESRRIPLHVWAMVVIGVAGFLIVWFTR